MRVKLDLTLTLGVFLALFFIKAQEVKPLNPKADRALFDAVRKGAKGSKSIEKVKNAIAEGANLEAMMQGGYTPLHLVAIYDRREIAVFLVANGANVNSKNKRGMTPLHQATRSGRNEIAELLINKGANVNVMDENSLTPLDLAIERKKTETADLLRKYGAKRGAAYSIHIAAKSDIESVKKHLESGVKVNAKDKIKGTPLHYAAAYGNMNIVELLITSGADLNAKDNEGKTTLHYAAINGRKLVVEFLVENGAVVNVKAKDGNTPLDATFVFNKSETANLLRKYGGKTKQELEVGKN